MASSADIPHQQNCICTDIKTGDQTQFTRIASGGTFQEISENPRPIAIIIVISILSLFSGAILTSIIFRGGGGTVINWLVDHWYVGIIVVIILIAIATILGIKASEGFK